MSLADDLSRLSELHQRGALSDDEFDRAKARLLGGLDASPGASDATPLQAVNALRLSARDRWIAGVCGGLAAATGLASWVWRLVFALLACAGGTGVIVYALMWLLVPREPEAAPPAARSA